MDFISPAFPTELTYTTPYTRLGIDPPERLGPVCNIQYEIVPHPCVVDAHVAEDTTTIRAPEDVGFVVFERGHGNPGAFEFDAQLTADTVRGVANSPPYPGFFTASFPAPPLVQLASSAAMDGR